MSVQDRFQQTLWVIELLPLTLFSLLALEKPLEILLGSATLQGTSLETERLLLTQPSLLGPELFHQISQEQGNPSTLITIQAHVIMLVKDLSRDQETLLDHMLAREIMQVVILPSTLVSLLFNIQAKR